MRQWRRSPAVDARVDHVTVDWYLLLDKKALKEFPVGELALERDGVVISVHLDVQTKVSRENFCDQKAVAEIPLRVLDGI